MHKWCGKLTFFLSAELNSTLFQKRVRKICLFFITTIIIVIKIPRNTCLLAMWIDSYRELLASPRFISKFSELTRLLKIRRILSAWAILQRNCQSLKQTAKRRQRFVQIWLCLQCFVVVLSLCLYHDLCLVQFLHCL